MSFASRAKPYNGRSTRPSCLFSPTLLLRLWLLGKSWVVPSKPACHHSPLIELLVVILERKGFGRLLDNASQIGNGGFLDRNFRSRNERRRDWHAQVRCPTRDSQGCLTGAHFSLQTGEYAHEGLLSGCGHLVVTG